MELLVLLELSSFDSSKRLNFSLSSNHLQAKNPQQRDAGAKRRKPVTIMNTDTHIIIIIIIIFRETVVALVRSLFVCTDHPHKYQSTVNCFQLAAKGATVYKTSS